MKAKILTTILPFSFFLSYAQNYAYIPLVNEECVWSYCDVVKAGLDEYDLDYSQFKFNSDTIINDISYKKLFRHDCTSNKSYYVASMREENKKVYAVYSERQQEQLIYNFNLVVGDSMQSPYDDTYYFWVTKIDTIEVASGKRKRIELNFDTWIEGIGTLDRFMMYPLQGVHPYDLGVRINYQKQGDEIIYKTDEWYFNKTDCGTSLIEKTELNKTVAYFITPELLRIETDLSSPNCTFELLDLNGKLLLQGKINRKNNTINLSQFSDGLYFFRISSRGEAGFVGKIIKK